MSAMKSKSKNKKFDWKSWLGEGHFGKRLIMTILFFIALAIFLHFREVRVEVVEQGVIADRYMIAHVDFEFPDDEATRVIKQQSVRDVGMIYRISEKQLRQIRFDFETYLLTHSDWRDKLKSATFDELYRGADSLEDVLSHARFTNSRTLQKMKDYGLSTKDIYIYTPENLQERAILPKTIWNKVRERAFVSENFSPEIASFILDSFENVDLVSRQRC